MPLIMQAFILCATDDTTEAEAAVYAALNGGVFESSSPMLDFEIGVERYVDVGPNYEEGSIPSLVPAARIMKTANPMSMPC